jgi:hypothetical protein
MTSETPRKGKPPTTRKGEEADPAQYERFMEAAHKLGCEDNAGRLNEVVRRAATLPAQRASAKPKKAKSKRP